jgi:glycosyltransferase involved in cell wall biosynthesis
MQRDGVQDGAPLRTADTEAPSAAVIVPCFNDGATLREAVESVSGQAGLVELVVVDDGSTDPATVVALDALEADGVRALRQSNQGPAAATMAGVLATTANYVMRLDADDVLEPGSLTALSSALDVAPDAAVAWGDVQTFGLTSFRIPAIPNLDPWLLTYTNCIPGAGCLVRRSALVEAGGWQLRDGWEDWDLWLALAERGWKGVYVPRVTFHYRRDQKGRHMESLEESESHYADLRRRHERLFTSRQANRRASIAPRTVKLAVPLIERLPGLSRLLRIQLCQLVVHLFWNGGFRATFTMAKQAVSWRLAARQQAAKH